MDGADLPGHLVRQYDDLCLPAVRAAGVPGAGSTVRKLDPAAGRDSDRADVDPVCPLGREADRWRQQCVHPDRAVRAGGAGVEERDSDRGICPRTGRPWPQRRASRAGSVPFASASDPDDVDRLHHGRGAPGVLARRRFGNAPCHGRGGVRRHAGRDLLRRRARGQQYGRCHGGQHGLDAPDDFLGFQYISPSRSSAGAATGLAAAAAGFFSKRCARVRSST